MLTVVIASVGRASLADAVRSARETLPQAEILIAPAPDRAPGRAPG